MSAELSSRINVKLPEELKLESIMEDVQKWQAQLKKKYQVRTFNSRLRVNMIIYIK